MDRRRSTHLIDALYGMDPRTPDWTPFIALAAQAFASPVVAVQVHDRSHRHGRMTTAVGASPRLLALHATLSYDHPWFERCAGRLLSEGLADDHGLMTESELRATRFYGEYMAEACIGHGMALCMYAQGRDDLAMLTVNRDWSGGHYDEHEWGLARSLLPHLRNVYALQQRFGWMQSQSQNFHAALDQLSDGVLLLSAAGQVRFGNATAQQMEADRLFTRRPDGRLGMYWPADDHRLQQILHQLCATDAAEPVLQQLHRRDGRLAGMLKFCPAGMVAGTHWSELDVRVIIFIKSVATNAKSTATGVGLQGQWGFTSAEAQLAQSLMLGLSLTQAAEHGGVTKNTVRTQLRSLFDKTHTRRQSELMRMLMQLSHS